MFDVTPNDSDGWRLSVAILYLGPLATVEHSVLSFSAPK